MNNKNKTYPSRKEGSCPDFQAALSERNCVTYRLRTECLNDADLVRMLLNRWLLAWSQMAADVDEQGEIRWPDVDVELKLKKSAPPLRVLRWLIDQLPDCHVASESLDHAESYNGERTNRKSNDPIEPHQDVLAQASQDAAWVAGRLNDQRVVLRSLSKSLGGLR
jgi:hypothetical protein